MELLSCAPFPRQIGDCSKDCILQLNSPWQVLVDDLNRMETSMEQMRLDDRIVGDKSEEVIIEYRATLKDSSQSTEQQSNVTKEQHSLSKRGENSRKQQGTEHSKTQGKGDSGPTKKTPQKKYTSLSDLASDSSALSPSAIQILSSGNVPDKVLMRTGKVGDSHIFDYC